MLQKLRPASQPTDHLFVGTDGYNYFVLSWDPSSKQLRTEKSCVDLSDKTGRDSQSADRCLIDPARRFLALELFEGIVTIFPIGQRHKKKGDLEQGTLGEPVPVRIPELFVRSYAFLHSRSTEKEKIRLAILYEDGHDKVELIIRTLEYLPGLNGEPGSADLMEENKRDRLQEDFDFGASHIIPVPAPACGFLVLSETSIKYVVDPSYETLVEPLRQATIFVTWTQVDAQRWLLADDYGSLYFLMLILEVDEVVGWKLDLLGKTSRASVLVYLDSGLVYVGSHQGDSQIIKIEEKSLEVIQTFSNIAPILDFTIMDMGSRSGEGQVNEFSSGQARIVTGSGAYQDGSLRSVRSGVGLEELGSLGEMHHITEIFELWSSPPSEKVDTLVVSFIDETRVFRFNEGGEVEESEDYKGFIFSESTLLAQNLPQDRLLQVTASTIQITELENGMSTSSWKPPAGQAIVAASTNGLDVIVSVGGTELFILNLFEDLQVTSQKSFGTDNQISCVNMPSVTRNIVVVGFWRDAVVTIFDSGTLNELQTFRVNEEAAAVPRSVLLTQVLAEQPPILFIAMADGNVVTYNVNPSTFAVSEKNSTILGTQQANLKAIPREGNLFNVFATCEHPSMIYGSDGRLIFSAVTAEHATCICPFDSVAYPGAIAIATPEDLKIALVDIERTTHVQTLHVGETVRRIAYSTKLKAFGFGTIKRTLKEAVEVVESYFELADEIVFEELDKYALSEDEIIESVARIDVLEDDGETSERFIVGTAYLNTYPNRSTRGRILVFEVTAERLLRKTAEVALKGACRALAVMDGMVVAALTKTVSRSSLVL
jgi:DNA damage-binding protein 1